MKQTFLLLAFACIASSLSAITNYKAGDKLYVLATSGLTLRDKPDINGAKITTLEHGAPLTVQAADLKKKAYSVTEFKDYTLKGYWVKVKTWDDKEGYVFDGYLSKYQAPAKVLIEGHLDDKYCQAEQYMLVHSKLKGKRIELKKYETTYAHYKQLFVNTAEVEMNGGEGGSSQTIKFDKFTSIEEAYLIGKALWLDGKAAKSKIEKGVITLSDADELNIVTIQQKGGVVFLEMGHAD